jgi:DNA-binding response OmpR family regulator
VRGTTKQKKCRIPLLAGKGFDLGALSQDLGQLKEFWYNLFIMENSQILLVEDDVFLSSLLKNRLEKEGLNVSLAKDGDEALNLLKSLKPSLILLDLILPKKSGFEVMEEIKNDPQMFSKEVPIIIISNLGQPEDVNRGQELGAIEYFVKAKTSIDELVGKIKEFLV